MFCDFIFTHPFPITWLLRSYHIDCALLIQYYDILIPIHVDFCRDIGITTCYQGITIVNCHMNFWWRFSSTRACLPLWLTRKRLTLVSDSLYHMYVTPSLNSFNLFQNITVGGCNFGWIRWNKSLIILLWYSCWWACHNVLCAVFCDINVVLQWEY